MERLRTSTKPRLDGQANQPSSSHSEASFELSAKWIQSCAAEQPPSDRTAASTCPERWGIQFKRSAPEASIVALQECAVNVIILCWWVFDEALMKRALHAVDQVWTSHCARRHQWPSKSYSKIPFSSHLMFGNEFPSHHVAESHAVAEHERKSLISLTRELVLRKTALLIGGSVTTRTLGIRAAPCRQS